jgi:hypothetical protein
LEANLMTNGARIPPSGRQVDIVHGGQRAGPAMPGPAMPDQVV